MSREDLVVGHWGFEMSLRACRGRNMRRFAFEDSNLHRARRSHAMIYV